MKDGYIPAPKRMGKKATAKAKAEAEAKEKAEAEAKEKEKAEAEAKAKAKKAPAKRREKGKDTPYGSGYYIFNDTNFGANYDKLKEYFDDNYDMWNNSLRHPLKPSGLPYEEDDWVNFTNAKFKKKEIFIGKYLPLAKFLKKKGWIDYEYRKAAGEKAPAKAKKAPSPAKKAPSPAKKAPSPAKKLSSADESRLSRAKQQLQQMNKMRDMGMMMDEDQREEIEDTIRRLSGEGLFSKKGDRYTAKVDKILKDNGSKVIKSISVKRTPLNWLMTGTLNAVSFGLLNKRMEENDIDELFHLFMELVMEDGMRIGLEKNERIDMNVNMKTRPKTETEPIDAVGSGITLDELMQKTRDKMGDDKYFNYSAKNNNCSDFILAVMDANDIGNDGDKAFVRQDAKTLFGKSTFLRKLVNTATDIAGKITDVRGNDGNRCTNCRSARDCWNRQTQKDFCLVGTCEESKSR